METNAYHSTAECRVQQHICNEDFFNQNFLRTFRGHQDMNGKKFFRKFQAAAGFSALLFLVLYAYAKNPDCKKFKNGKFKVAVKELGMTFYIVREGERQTEIMDGEQDSSVFVVKWIDDCTYTLVPTKETWQKKYSFLPEDNVLTIKIFRTTDSSYFQQSSSNFADLVDTSEVIILH